MAAAADRASIYLTTPDGRAGWATLFVEQGRLVYVVDRPGHGRSPVIAEVMGAAVLTRASRRTIGEIDMAKEGSFDDLLNEVVGRYDYSPNARLKEITTARSSTSTRSPAR